MVFNTDSGKFYYYFSGAWRQIGTGSGALSLAWGLYGNSGTNPNVNFIGNTDDSSLIFKVGGIKSGEINSAITGTNSNSVGFGYGALYSQNGIDLNSAAFGNGALSQNIDGVGNTAVGGGAIYNNINGNDNTGIGNSSLFALLSGDENTAIGENSLSGIDSGSFNTAIGAHSLKFTKGGSNNIAIGSNSGQYGQHTHRLFIDAVDRSDSVKQERNSLITGTFGNDSSTNKLRINGKLTISDGTQGSGKVLTSDANGVCSWQTLSLTDIATLDFGNILANGHEVKTITVTGAALGDVVSLGIPNSSMSDHASFVAWVSASDTVSVKCFNFDGSSFDPAAGVFKVKIFK